jgi:hypothetical protein
VHVTAATAFTWLREEDSLDARQFDGAMDRTIPAPDLGAYKAQGFGGG